MKSKAKRVLSILMTAIMIITSMGFPVAGAETVTMADHVIISQVYGAGGNVGSKVTNDYIELFNPTSIDQDLTGWSVQYASATGSFSGLTPLSGIIKAGSYYLVQQAAGTNTTALPLPTADILGKVSMGGTNFKVALVKNTEAISGIADEDVEDFVGVGTANAYEGSGAAPAASSEFAVVRKTQGVDTNDNALDFIKVEPNPTNSKGETLAEPEPETKCAEVKSSIASGSVPKDTAITFSTATVDAEIEYNTVAADATEWTKGSVVTIAADTTYYVRAVKAGLENSDVATFTYTLDVAAPLTVIQAKETALNTENVKVKGIVSYVSGQNVYIQDSEAAICLYFTANATVKVGDEIIATGKRANYSNLVQLSGVDGALVTVVSTGNAIPDLGTVTLAELIATPEGKTPGYDHMCETLNVSGVTLAELGKFSQSEANINIYPTVDLAKYPGIVLGDEVNAKIRMTDYKGTLQVSIIEMSKVGSENNIYLTVTPASTDVTSGASIAITCSESTAKIYYTLDGTAPTSASTLYTGAVKVSGEIGDTITLKAFAQAEGKNDSEVVTNVYTIKDPNVASNIKEVLAYGKLEVPNVTVQGTLVYFATDFSNPLIQSEIDGQMYSLYVFGSAPEGAKVGDVVQFTGTYKYYYGLPELVSSTKSSIISAGTPIPAEQMTVAEIKANGSNMIGRFIKIKDATLGKFNASGSTPITDSTGTINIYKGTAFPTGVVEGDVVDVYAMIAAYNTTIQLYTGTREANGFNVYDVANDTKPPVITLKEGYLDARPLQDYTIGVNALDNKGVESVTISYKIGANVVENKPMTFNADANEYQFVIPGAEILASESQFTFTVTASDVTGLTATSAEKIILIDNKPHIIAVSPARNGSTGGVKNPLISVTLQNAGELPEVKLTLKKDSLTLVDGQIMTVTEANVSYSYQTETLADGSYTATVSVKRADGETATTTWTFVVGTPTFRAYFGQLHAHTAEYSDGSGTLADGLNYIKNITASDRVDFVAITDHSNYFDTSGAPNVAEALNDKTKMTAESLAKWNKYVSAMTDFNMTNAGSKVALPGFEMTWSGGPGHINTFNSSGLVSRNNKDLNNKSADAGLKAYYETLIQDPNPLANLSQFNHPGTTFGTFSEFAYWSPSYDNKMVAVEVGNGEGAIGSGGYFPSYAEYTKALDKGWHVAPSNNQDNHKGRWGNANTARTVIITDDLSTNGLLQGMKNMSVYATEDKNLNIDYTVNDLMVGSIINEVPTEALKFVVNVDDPDSSDVISKVEIVTNSGRIADSKTFTTNAAQWNFELPAVQGYYYVRVTQADMNIAVTAPIWVGQAPLVGIGSFESMTKLPVTGEAVNLETKIFNNESSTVSIKSITYKMGERVLKAVTEAISLATMGTHADSLSYTPDVSGNATITVEAVIEIDGQEKTFDKTIILNVRDSEKLIYVGIDASHYNEYVAGNYKDSMGNFANMAVEYDVRVVELNTSEALIAATTNPKFKMLVLTPPTRRDDKYFKTDYKSYSEEEIAAIKIFVEAGNSIILTGWGDYYESYTQFSDGTLHTLPADQQMSAQQNQILKAIGSTLRISDDEVKDDVNNGGQPQRLYLKNYNLLNPFNAGVKADEQVFSSYAGSTIYTVDGDLMPSNTIPSSVSPLVFAFETSYSSDDDKDGTTGIKDVVVPKYENKYMVAASESIPFENGNTATIIAAGAAFMSNFEIQVTMDSYATPAYSNYTILENIIKTLNPVTVTNIADVQAAEEGQSFTIRGIVTSNASGFDKDTAFFDCIYVQDGTAGINAFPVAGDVRAGQLVEIKGTTSSYNGERQIAVEKVTIIDENISPLPAPIKLTTEQAKAAMHLGSLIKVTGQITRLEYSNNVIESIFVKDGSGVETRVFIDGYITKDKAIANLAVGANITAVGLSSIDTEGSRIRVRDRADVVCTSAPGTGNNEPDDEADDTPDPTEEIDGEETPLSNRLETEANGKLALNTETINAYEEAGQMLSIGNGNTEYRISAKELSNENILKTFAIGAEEVRSVEVEVEIGAVSDEVKAQYEAAARTMGGMLLVPPVTFKVNVKVTKTDGTVVNESMSKFDSYVERILEIPADVDPSTVTTGVVILADGTMEHVPTVVFEADGKWYARINSLTNSTYALLMNKITVASVANHWSKAVVDEMASKMILTKSDGFAPDKAVTRGEFAEYLVRALGLFRSDAAYANQFSDVDGAHANALAIGIAKDWGLIAGYEDGTFRANGEIKREEAMSMYLNAVQYMALEKPETNDSLVKFNDQSEVSSWARSNVEDAVALGLFKGRTGTVLAPKGTLTHAESLAAVMNLLNVSDLMK